MAEQQTTAALSNQLELFLRGFKDKDDNYKYFDRINHMMASNSTSLIADYIDLDVANPEIAKLITYKPDETLEAFNEAVVSILREIHFDYAEEIKEKVKVRIGNYTVQKGLRDINAEVIDKLIGVSGMVVRSSEVKPLAKKIGYRCLNCETVNEVPDDLTAGQLPHYVEVTVMGDLVDQCRPGDRIMLTGIIRIEQEQISA